MPSLRPTAIVHEVHLREPFRISRGTQTVARPVIVELRVDGLAGYGEADPSSFYGETTESVLAALHHLGPSIECDIGDIQTLQETIERSIRLNPAARSAVLCAAYDLAGKALGVPVYRLVGLNPERTPHTSFTIGIAEPDEMARKAQAAASYPILKVKVGTDDDARRLKAIREVRPDAIIRVDANAAWNPREAIRNIEQLSQFDLQFVEQPVAAHDVDGLAWVRQHSSLPIFADESCVTAFDVPRIAPAVDGIVVKLAKCGGIPGALDQINAAHLFGKEVMLGCMIETSLGITAAAHISPLVEYADLDGHLLIRDDPFLGVGVEQGKLILPRGAGLGVRGVHSETAQGA
ncbi:MAG: dipeptide epimerase [Chloroflexi bacterium]|nr:dipeptide epimerase [Chloroflexota bacterium]